MGSDPLLVKILPRSRWPGEKLEADDLGKDPELARKASGLLLVKVLMEA